MRHTKKNILPEEQVRRWFIDELVAAGVDRHRIAVEYSVIVGARRLRVDLAIFEAGRTTISAIVECKAPSVALCAATIEQAAAYNSVLAAPYIIMTNGHHTFIYNSALKCFIDQLPSDL